MADYAFRTVEERQEIQKLWEKGRTPKEISETLGKSLAVVYRELSRGQDGSRLPEPDGRLRYDAAMAQRRARQSLEKRGRKASRATDCKPAAGQ